MKTEYVKIIENDPTKKARLVTAKRSENEYEIVEFYVPREYIDKGIGEELLEEVTSDADKEMITLHMNIDKILRGKE